MDMPEIENVANYLRELQRHWTVEPIVMSEDENEEQEGVELEVRLQVRESGSYALHTGDSQYDTDHRGYWGSGFLTSGTDCEELARELIEEAAEHAAQCEND